MSGGFRLTRGAGGAAAVISAVAVVAVVTACSGQPGDITAAGQNALVPKVKQVRAAAASGSQSRLEAAVRSLEAAVDRQKAAGHVSAERATAIDDAAGTLLVDFKPSSKPTTASPSPSFSPTPTQSQSATTTPTQSASATPTASATDTGSPSPATTISVP